MVCSEMGMDGALYSMSMRGRSERSYTTVSALRERSAMVRITSLAMRVVG